MSGYTVGGDYPTTFSAEDGVLWKAAMPGFGSSTPVVWDDHIFISSGTSRDRSVAGQDAAICYDWSGKKRWQVELGTERIGKHRNGSGSCSSAVTDGKSVFFYFKSGNLAALDFDGKVIWKTNLQETYGPDSLWWDLGTSPVLAGDNVVVAVMHEGDSYMVALDKATGKETWKVDRNFDCEKETHQSYTTPLVMEQGGKTALIVWGADHLTAHDAVDGSTIWTCGGFNPEDKAYWRVIATPAVTKNVAVVPYGRANLLAGVRLGGSGDVTQTHRLWESSGFGADVPAPVAVDGKAYVLADKGELLCLDVETGEQVWKSKLPKGSGKFFGSPTLAGDTMFLLRESGQAIVGKISDAGFDVLSINDMGERLASSPVAVADKLLIRGDTHLFCVGK